MSIFLMLIIIIAVSSTCSLCLINLTAKRNKITKILLLISVILLLVSVGLGGIITSRELDNRIPKSYKNEDKITISYNEPLYNSDLVTIDAPLSDNGYSSVYATIITANWDDGSCDGIEFDNCKITLVDNTKSGETMHVILKTKDGNYTYDIEVK